MSRQRKIIRLPDFDYRSDGAYSITICTAERRCVFGAIENGELKLNACGEIACDEILNIEKRREGVTVDEFIVMPNHIHLILLFRQTQKIETNQLPTRQFGTLHKNSLSSVIGGYKSGVARKINELQGEVQIWQPRFYEHIIRHEKDLFFQREYIKNNPANWQNDENNGARQGHGLPCPSCR